MGSALRRLRFFAAAVAVVVCGCTGLTAATRPAAPTEPFRAVVTGHGRPMILIPGLASSGEVWDGVVAHAQATSECHVLTLAGFAGQPAISAPFLTTERDAILGYIAAHHLDHPLIVGHSLGGVLALMVAEAAPDQVGPLLIVDSLPFLPAAFAPDASAQDLHDRAEQMRQLGRMQTLDQRARARTSALRAMITDPAKQAIANRWGVQSDADAVNEAMYEMSTTDVRPELAKIRVPVTVIGTWIGYKDFGSTHAHVEQTFRAQYAGLAQAKIVISDTARHFVMWDAPAEVESELDALRAKTSPAPATAAR